MYVQLQFDLLTLLHRFFCVVGDRDDPIGTGYFVLLLTLMCQLGCVLYLCAPRQLGSLPYCLCAKQHRKLSVQ